MVKKNLKQFDPEEIAKFDSEMWQAYYKRRFFKLFFILLRLARKIHADFGVSYFLILRGTYFTAFAAADFSLHKGRENAPRILKKLSHAFKLLSEGSVERFDYKRAAELELEWWLIDRYPARYEISREEGLARAMAVIYNTAPEKLKDYARYRALAMVLQDKAQEEQRQADWHEIEGLLKKSFASLYETVNGRYQ